MLFSCSSTGCAIFMFIYRMCHFHFHLQDVPFSCSTECVCPRSSTGCDIFMFIYRICYFPVHLPDIFFSCSSTVLAFYMFIFRNNYSHVQLQDLLLSFTTLGDQDVLFSCSTPGRVIFIYSVLFSSTGCAATKRFHWIVFDRLGRVRMSLSDWRSLLHGARSSHACCRG